MPYDPNHKPVVYKFIDGGYLRDKFTKQIGDFYGERDKPTFSMLDLARVAGKAKKTFYYDCLRDEKKDSESEADFASVKQQQNEEMVAFRRAEGCHVKLGSLKGRNKKIRQKEVDVLLSVDMMTQAFRKNYDRAILVAGDLDFKPVVDSLVDMGVDVELHYQRGTASEDMLGAADRVVKFDLHHLMGWLGDKVRAKFQFGRPREEGNDGVADRTLLKTLDLESGRLSLWVPKEGAKDRRAVGGLQIVGARGLVLYNEDPWVIERYFSLGLHLT